ncbi:arginine/serine-rich coiled-coil protein 2 [Pyrus ussuriensis x Pyrus communis]|uniref:Arginine/serine-rich coiled-coil protein 2 n=1 Tax=Pyrus ussuriensis x Pyrus communis TaxID=2448454 RepID=A0A5N5I684_9ROSA|nr:arginine/serine-rich coiled-coil protein 2 [Pyrus ussuriensis x Pyrus communis]
MVLSLSIINHLSFREKSPLNKDKMTQIPSNFVKFPVHEHSSSPRISREYPVKISEYRTRRREDEREFERNLNRCCYGKSSDSYRNYDRQSFRTSHGYHRHDDYIKHDKHGDEEERHYQKLSSRLSRETRGSAHSDYTRIKIENLHFLSTRNNDKDSSSEKVGYGRRHGYFEEMDKERGRQTLDRDAPDEKKDYHRSSGDYRSDAFSPMTSPRGNEKYDDKDTKVRNRNTREPSEQSAYGILRSQNEESSAKRPKLFSSEKNIDGWKDVSKFTTTAGGKESSNSKPSQEGFGKTMAYDAKAANDRNAVKFAAMKAAEVVNKNPVGVGPAGCMTADQKKKLLWGNKTNTTAEEAGHHWDTTFFSDRERQEKFNKLMGVKGEVKVENKPKNEDQKQKEVQLNLEKQYTARLRR